MTHPTNQSQPLLHITNSEDLNIEQVTQRIQQTNNSENWLECEAKQPAERKIGANILLEGLQNMGKNVTYSQMDGHQFQCGYEMVAKQMREESIPEPLESDEEQSQQAQYLSYLENPIVHEIQQQNTTILTHPTTVILRDQLTHAYRHQFLSILYQSMVYVRKEQKRTKIDDQLLADRLNDHLIVSTAPNSKSQIGKALLANGYFLCAFAVLMGRVNKSEVLFRYIMEKFKEDSANIEDNLEDFLYYYSKPNEYFTLMSEQYIKSSHKHSTSQAISITKQNLSQNPIKLNTLKRIQPNTTNSPNKNNPENLQSQFNILNSPPNNHTNQNNNKQQNNRMKSTKITNITSHNKKQSSLLVQKYRENSPDC